MQGFLFVPPLSLISILCKPWYLAMIYIFCRLNFLHSSLVCPGRYFPTFPQCSCNTYIECELRPSKSLVLHLCSIEQCGQWWRIQIHCSRGEVARTTTIRSA